MPRRGACYQRFAVNDCLLDSRRARREVMADLRRQEVSLNDAQRKRRAAEQLLRSDEKRLARAQPLNLAAGRPTGLSCPAAPA
jgi:colicin import membrane protein